MKPLSTRSALVRFALVAAAAGAAASLWAQNRPEQGLLLDALTWQQEVVSGHSGPWPSTGWYRIAALEQDIDVRAVKPTERQAIPADALYFRLPGTTLKTGLRPGLMHLEMVRPRDDDAARPGRYTVRVEEVDASVRYQIGYAGHTYTYVVGPAGASTSVRAVADLDGDSRPDFLVDVEGLATYLLLSTRAQPGLNLPTAEMPADGC
ncbi:hypothetical protein H8N03_13795 [Ramlibacter sp. USB13]|uniref:VCBS repeat-containing protein n=1 Tax=Ramlibacter cellulosilyticus TaxID=2764187 RepID=A0A923MSW6_9BURK|nr:hypothetical protein [Ramlibacter cellulosilyticus]MBC5784019.1 hypothetical protein [Ramlibacter cellulosilyticus]